MRSGLDGLAGFVVVTPRVSRVFTRPINEDMITEPILAPRIRQPPDGIRNRHPMRGFCGPFPFQLKIVPEPDDEHTFATLRHAVIDGVEQSILNIVLQATICRKINFAQFCEMYPPIHAIWQNHFRERQP